jgi:hypothetical protein
MRDIIITFATSVIRRQSMRMKRVASATPIIQIE